MEINEDPKVCQFCGRVVHRLSSHHLIPRWLGGSDEDTIEVCDSCHTKLEGRFESFFKWQSFSPKHWYNRKKCNEYRHKYRKVKVLFTYTPVRCVRLQMVLDFNRKTDNFSIWSNWIHLGTEKYREQIRKSNRKRRADPKTREKELLRKHELREKRSKQPCPPRIRMARSTFAYARRRDENGRFL